LVDFTSDYHTYGLLVDGSKVIFYVDDALARVWIQPIVPIITDPQYLIMDLAIFGPNQTWGSQPDSTTQWPLRLLVDRVEVWGPSIISDVTPPEIGILFPGASVTRHSNQRVSASITDTSGVAQATLFVNGQSKGTLFHGPWDWNWNVPAKPNATYQLTVSAQDVFGNLSSKTIVVTAI
jgi:hypothetical protein